MSTQNEAVKDWLRRYRDAMRDSESLDNRIIALRSRLEAPGAARLDGMPRTPGFDADRTGAALALLEELEEDAKQARATARAMYAEIEAVIRRISGPGWPDQRAVLRMRYLDGERWEDVASLLFGTSPDYEERADSFLRRVHKTHAAALAAISEFVPLEQGQENNDK